MTKTKKGANCLPCKHTPKDQFILFDDKLFLSGQPGSELIYNRPIAYNHLTKI